MGTITVEHRGDDEFALRVRHHTVLVDQPKPDGGSEAGPTPTELFVASLAGCVAFNARSYLSRHGLPLEGLRVVATYSMSTDRPARVGAIDLRIEPPRDLAAGRVAGLLAVASHCTVHNSIDRAPRIDVGLCEQVPA